jgi:hypothetical protein
MSDLGHCQEFHGQEFHGQEFHGATMSKKSHMLATLGFH